MKYTKLSPDSYEILKRYGIKQCMVIIYGRCYRFICSDCKTVSIIKNSNNYSNKENNKCCKCNIGTENYLFISKGQNNKTIKYSNKYNRKIDSNGNTVIIINKLVINIDKNKGNFEFNDIEEPLLAYNENKIIISSNNLSNIKDIKPLNDFLELDNYMESIFFVTEMYKKCNYNNNLTYYGFRNIIAFWNSNQPLWIFNNNWIDCHKILMETTFNNYSYMLSNNKDGCSNFEEILNLFKIPTALQKFTEDRYIKLFFNINKSKESYVPNYTIATQSQYKKYNNLPYQVIGWINYYIENDPELFNYSTLLDFVQRMPDNMFNNIDTINNFIKYLHKYQYNQSVFDDFIDAYSDNESDKTNYDKIDMKNINITKTKNSLISIKELSPLIADEVIDTLQNDVLKALETVKKEEL